MALPPITATAMAKPKSSNAVAPQATKQVSINVTEGIEDADNYVKILIYGAYGAGKTVFSAESVDIPDMRDVLLINIEGGHKSIRLSGAVANHALIDSVRVTDFAQFTHMHEFLAHHCRLRDSNAIDKIQRMNDLATKYGMPNERTYQTVIIDSLYELDSMNFRRLIGDKEAQIDQATVSDDLRGDYGRNRQIMHKAIRSFRNLPMHAIFTAPSLVDKDDVTKKTTISPMMAGKLRKEVQGYMDVVAYLVAGEAADGQPIRRRLYLQSNGKFDAKCRLTPQSLTHIDDPTMAKLMQSLLGYDVLTSPPPQTSSKPAVADKALLKK